MQESVYIIAEAGVNHNGSLELAVQMLDEAAKAGADAVKFQTFKAEALAAANAQKADYQKKLTDSGESQLEMLKRLELSHEDHHILQKHAREKNIDFLSTPFDMESLHFLAKLNMPYFKLASGEITNLPYLEAVGALNTNVIVSTGLATLEEIGSALRILTGAGTPMQQISLLHANTAYPTPPCDVNLRAMDTIKNAFRVRVGYSDHTAGITVPIAAVARGALIIEKHFTLDCNMEGPDHASSLEPQELAAMVDAIRDTEKMLGDGIKAPSPSELVNLNAARKSIVAGKAIKAGDILTPENITIKRPGGGLSPMLWHHLIGTRAVRDFAADEKVTF